MNLVIQNDLSANPESEPADVAGEVTAECAPRRRRAWLELRRDIPVWGYRLLAGSGFALSLVFWWWLSHREFVNPVFLPTPGAVWDAAGDALGDENLWIDVKASFFRVTAGFLLAAAAGVPLGVFVGSFKVFEGLFQPITEFVRYVPVPALIPIFMVLFGIDELSKVMVIWVGTFFQLVLMVADEVRRVPYELLQVSYTLGARRRETIRLVLWRGAMPGIFDALRLCNGWAWTYLVVAELVAANEGLGYRILKFSRFLQTPKILGLPPAPGRPRPGPRRRVPRAQPPALPLGRHGEAVTPMTPPLAAARLDVRRISKTYASRRATVQALLPTSFQLAEGEFVSLLGPSGCGKSTALQLVAGLDEPTSGEIRVDGEPVVGPGRDRGMVFQHYTLFPWLTVLENARFASELRCNEETDGEQVARGLARTRSLLDLMGLRAFHGAYPRELSGGMKQRVAIARALANRPKVLLMDEPFGALDAQTREEMQRLMLLLQGHEPMTVLFVTHDVEEAIYLSSRVLVFSPRPGRVVRDVAVPFGEPSRRVPDIKLAPEFMQLKRDLIGLLHPGGHAVDREALFTEIVHTPPGRSP